MYTYHMKKLLLLLFLLPHTVIADNLNLEFYEPNISNAYQGRLIYDSMKQEYPIDNMIKLCKPYTGIDTAQTKCKHQKKKNMIICEYKCSMHWLTNKE